MTWIVPHTTAQYIEGRGAHRDILHVRCAIRVLSSLPPMPMYPQEHRLGTPLAVRETDEFEAGTQVLTSGMPLCLPISQHPLHVLSACDCRNPAPASEM